MMQEFIVYVVGDKNAKQPRKWFRRIEFPLPGSLVYALRVTAESRGALMRELDEPGVGVFWSRRLKAVIVEEPKLYLGRRSDMIASRLGPRVTERRWVNHKTIAQFAS